MTPQEIAEQIHPLRDYLVKVAFIQLRDQDLAEDVAQETILGALAAADRFQERSKVKTWIVGILKHKIIDAIRARAAERRNISTFSEEGEDIADLLFDTNGRWNERPTRWETGEFDLEQKQFMRVLDACIEHLPELHGKVFVMKEVMEMESAEICNVLDIKPTYLWVILHRARLSLQVCLNKEWFGNPEHSHA